MTKYFIFTFGCQMNVSDSERIEAILKKQGHKPAKKPEQADLIVINACSVRQSAMHRVYNKINKFHKENKKVILAGCVLESDRKKLKDKISDFWHPSKYFHSCPEKKSVTPRKSAFVPIMTGCNNFCSYCVVPYTRGREKSRPADKIIKEAKSLIKSGYGEIILLGQNVNSYKTSVDKKNYSSSEYGESRSYIRKSSRQARTINISFPYLLRFINSLPGDFVIKFLTSHPKDMSNELINTIAECEKISKEIHLPIQSGDNAILRKMNRRYTAEHYKKLIKKIRAKIPNAKISTDIIVGFPGETKKQFENTVKLCKEVKFSIAYINKYSPRLGTAAYKIKDDISIQEKKKRWKILDQLINRKAITAKRLGK